MTRKHSPNHPAVRSWHGEPRQTVRQRTQAVHARRGRTYRDGKTGDRVVIGASAFILAIGLVESYPWVAVLLGGVAVACAWPWIRETIEEVKQWH